MTTNATPSEIQDEMEEEEESLEELIRQVRKKAKNNLHQYVFLQVDMMYLGEFFWSWNYYFACLDMIKCPRKADYKYIVRKLKILKI